MSSTVLDLRDLTSQSRSLAKTGLLLKSLMQVTRVGIYSKQDGLMETGNLNEVSEQKPGIVNNCLELPIL